MKYHFKITGLEDFINWWEYKSRQRGGLKDLQKYIQNTWQFKVFNMFLKVTYWVWISHLDSDV